MTDPNQSFASVHGITDSPAGGIDRLPWQNPESVSRNGSPRSELQTFDHDPSDSIAVVVSEVEKFTRGWIGRIRRLIHRSSQLIERESLLAGAIARLDQQKSEWSKRTASKEEGLRDQSKKLTEAWLEVESLRRKAIQGARIAASTSPKSAIAAIVTAGGGPVVAPASIKPIASPQGLVVPRPVMPPTASAELHFDHPEDLDSVEKLQPSGSDEAAKTIAESQRNVSVFSPAGTKTSEGHPVTQVQSVANTPILSDRLSPPTVQSCDSVALEHAEAATRQRIEEFKRMQRALRSNRNK